MYTMIPFRTMNTFPSLLNDHFLSEFFDTGKATTMRVDVREQEDAYLLEADLPGVEREHIDLKVEDGVLTISAEQNVEKKEERDGYVCSERRYGHMERSFNMEGIDVENIKADYKNGVLMVHLPKEKLEDKKNIRKIAIGEEQPKLGE